MYECQNRYVSKREQQRFKWQCVSFPNLRLNTSSVCLAAIRRPDSSPVGLQVQKHKQPQPSCFFFQDYPTSMFVWAGLTASFSGAPVTWRARNERFHSAIFQSSNRTSSGRGKEVTKALACSFPFSLANIPVLCSAEECLLCCLLSS